ncbi:MAG: putative porin [Verrucomicrobiota bacterium]
MTRRNIPSKRSRKQRCLAGGAALLTALAASRAGATGTNDPLMQVLIRKGVITEQEAIEIAREVQTNTPPAAVAPETLTNAPATNAPAARAATPATAATPPSDASKWKLSKAIKDIGLYGDLRFRYEYRGADNLPGASPSTYYLERFRYAARIGIRGDLVDRFNYGLRIETGSNPRSPWVTFANDSNPTPSSKANDGIYIGQAYLGWKPADWYEMTIGKMPMPIYTTPMVWDSDINPEGAFEKVKASVGQVDLFCGLGQFIYQDVNPSDNIPSSSAFLWAWQVGGTLHIDKYSSFKIAPVYYNHTGQGSSAQLNAPFVGQGGPVPQGTNVNTIAYNQNGINNLSIIEVPAEYNLKMGLYHLRLFGDLAFNIQGNERAQAAWNVGRTVNAFPAYPTEAPKNQNLAYQFGIGFGSEDIVYGPTQGVVYGSGSRRNAWEARVYWQHVEQFALDVNTLDSDFFEGRGNLEGIYTAFAYSFTDCIIGTVRYGYAKRITTTLDTGGYNPDLQALNPIDNYNLFQFDLTWRF